jgi:hypothetical protein
LTDVELISMPTTGDCLRLKRNTQYPYLYAGDYKTV